MKIKRDPVSSTSLKSVGYDEDTEELEIEFNDGRLYQYFSVPSNEYENFMNASSLGRYFVKNIRNNYSFNRIK